MFALQCPLWIDQTLDFGTNPVINRSYQIYVTICFYTLCSWMLLRLLIDTTVPYKCQYLLRTMKTKWSLVFSKEESLNPLPFTCFRFVDLPLHNLTTYLPHGVILSELSSRKVLCRTFVTKYWPPFHLKFKQTLGNTCQNVREIHTHTSDAASLIRVGVQINNTYWN